VTGPRSSARTLISCLIPKAGVSGKFPLLMSPRRDLWLLYSNLCSFILDYASRQKLGGVSLSMFVMKQLPVFPPSVYELETGWSAQTGLRDWLRMRVLELTFVSWDLEPFAQECGWAAPPFRWDEERRFLLRCELDSAFFHLYFGTTEEWRRQPKALTHAFPTAREAVSYIMETFPIVKRRDEEKWGEYRTKRVILEVYDAMAEAMRTGIPYQTRLDPPPANPSCCHPKKKIGILAYGSLITDPGAELLPLIQFRIKTETPFPVEYGRLSQSRGGAPTLVPHPAGAPVYAEILVLDDSTSIEQVENILYRREIHQVGSDKTFTPRDDPARVQVREYHDAPCVETVLFTDFNDLGKIPTPAPEELAKKAIASVKIAGEGKDGITYLIQARDSEIDTRLTAAYVDQILILTGAKTLREALGRARQ